MAGFLSSIYRYFRCYLDVCINFFFGLYFDSSREYIPGAKNDIVLSSATKLAKDIREKKLKSEYVVSTFIERIKEVNGILNAVVDERFDKALEEARKIDDNIEKGMYTKEEFERLPFLGVPFTSKESTACVGMKWSFGLISRKDVTAEHDADVIKLVKNAGAILLGVTNIPELNMWSETYNLIYGVTKNPFNTTRNVGGSSGGEGSIIAAGGSPFGIGTDIGGSIRIPSFRCGLFGHKCSPDLTPTYGLTFRGKDEGPTMVVSGPMTKYAEDLVPLIKIIVGPNVHKLKLDEFVDVKKIKVYYVKSTNCLYSSPVTEETIDVIMKVVQHFSEISESAPKEVQFEGTRHSIRIWSYMMTKENSNYKLDIMNKKAEANVFYEIMKYFVRFSEFCFYTIMNLINLALPKPSKEWTDGVINNLSEEIADVLGNNGVLLYPSDSFPASYHYTSIIRPYNISTFALWNALKFPVTQVPLGLNSAGLPLGLQVVSLPNQDRLCLAVAQELENTFGGYVPPFKMRK